MFYTIGTIGNLNNIKNNAKLVGVKPRTYD